MDNSKNHSISRNIGLFLVLVIFFNGLVFSGSWSHTDLIGTFHLAFFVHAGFTLYNGSFGVLRTKTWLFLIGLWSLAPVWMLLKSSGFFGDLNFWAFRMQAELESSGWHYGALALAAIRRLHMLWLPALLSILCVDIVVMHYSDWRHTPVRRSAIFIACASLGGLILAFALGALTPPQITPVPPVDPLQVPPKVTPEWFLLSYYTIMLAIPFKLGGEVIMFAAMLAPVVWPWMRVEVLRTGPFHSLWALLCVLLAATWIGLAFLGSRPPEPGTIYAARGLIAYYFAFFFILPPMLHRYDRLATASHAE